MGQFTRVADLQRRQAERFRQVGVKILTVHKELVSGGSQDFDELTAGSVSTRQLRSMGHPFGRSGGQGSDTGGRGVRKKLGVVGSKGQTTHRGGVLRPLPINRQTGKLRRGKFVRGPMGIRRAYDIGSSAPYEPFILSPTGTSKMVARGFWGPGGEFRKRHRARVQSALIVIRELQRKP